MSYSASRMCEQNYTHNAMKQGARRHGRDCMICRLLTSTTFCKAVVSLERAFAPRSGFGASYFMSRLGQVLGHPVPISPPPMTATVPQRSTRHEPMG